MNRLERSQFVMVVLILLGMVGLYYGLWRAYQLYQEKSAEFEKTGTVGTILNLFSK